MSLSCALSFAPIEMKMLFTLEWKPPAAAAAAAVDAVLRLRCDRTWAGCNVFPLLSVLFGTGIDCLYLSHAIRGYQHAHIQHRIRLFNRFTLYQYVIVIVTFTMVALRVFFVSQIYICVEIRGPSKSVNGTPRQLYSHFSKYATSDTNTVVRHYNSCSTAIPFATYTTWVVLLFAVREQTILIFVYIVAER